MPDFDPTTYLIDCARADQAELAQLAARHKVDGGKVAARLVEIRERFERELAAESARSTTNTYKARREAKRRVDALEAGGIRSSVLHVAETHAGCRRRTCEMCDAIRRLVTLMAANAAFTLEYRLAAAKPEPNDQEN